MRVALTIAGSDSGGGAGIQADLKTFHRFGVFGTSVITAVTAQNTKSVTEWSAVEPPLVRAQLNAVLSDLFPAAIKSGMLANADVIREIAAALRARPPVPYVLDPVMVATSGDVLLAPDAAAAIIAELFPQTSIVTPNTYEAALLRGGSPVTTPDAMRDAARFLVEELGAGAALVKGGHLSSEDAVDVFFNGDTHEFRHPRIPGASMHGTGCTLSAAIAANMAHGAGLFAAVEIALDFVHRAILLATPVGGGHVPLNHFA